MQSRNDDILITHGLLGDAYPRGRSLYRHWLSRTWDSRLPSALVIGINPNTATESEEDGMTRFLTRFLSGLEGEYRCGRYVLVNCCDVRSSSPQVLKDMDEPYSEMNFETVQGFLVKCDFVVASWGTTKYGKAFEHCRNEIETLVRRSGTLAICFSDNGTPIYCSQTNKNCNSHWSETPMLWA